MSGGEIAAVDVRRELCLDEADFAQLVAGTRVMSLSHQLALAALLIERVPRLARAGRMLRVQAHAAIAYAMGATTVHRSQPMKWVALKARRD
jgi:hypothetical protein